MRRLLSRAGKRQLSAFLAQDPLLAFDYDGTLAPIVADRTRAEMRATTRRLLERLCAHRPVVIISGRARRDLRTHLRGIAAQELIGNHGSEPWDSGKRFETRVRRWLPKLEELARRVSGVEIEDKTRSVSVHYRKVRDPRRASAEIHQTIDALPGVRIVGGKCLFNLLPAGAPDKGDALDRACAELGHETAIYVGDDDTDEDVFRRTNRQDWMTVRVGHRRASRARYYLERQGAIDGLLRLLLAEGT